MLGQRQRSKLVKSKPPSRWGLVVLITAIAGSVNPPSIAGLTVPSGMRQDGQLVDVGIAKRSFAQSVAAVQPCIVKIVGSGGFQGLEPYQSGFLISSDGLILTTWSYVLDSDVVTATLNDGQKFDAKLLGYDPRLEIAVLRIEAAGLEFLNLDEAIPAQTSTRVLAFSNLYGVAAGNEPASVQHGIVAGKTTLSARRGAFDSMYQGNVYILDAVTNNPGATGGAVTDRKGRLLGVIGKELRDKQTGNWINYSIPISEIIDSVNEIRAGKLIVTTDEAGRKPSEPMTLELLGIVLVPEVVGRTPPYVDRVLPDSVAAEAGLQPDDLLIDVRGRMTPAIADVLTAFSFVDRDSTMQVTVQRGQRFLTLELKLVR